jgi:hypothetical protein
MPSFGLTRVAGVRTGADAGHQVISVPRLAGLLSLGVLGLAGLLSLGVAGVVLVQGQIFRASEVGNRELRASSRRTDKSSSPVNARLGSGASARAAAGDPSAEVLGSGARLQGWAAQSGPALRRPASISKNRPESLETAYLETAKGSR